MHLPRIGRESKINQLVFFDVEPNPGPRHLPLDSVRGDVELACVFASVASAKISFLPESIFWQLAEQNVQK